MDSQRPHQARWVSTPVINEDERELGVSLTDEFFVFDVDFFMEMVQIVDGKQNLSLLAFSCHS